MRIKSIMELIC